MKAIIPVAGVGSKLRPHTYTQPKALIPVAGKPILSYIVDQLIEAGFNDFVFITGYLGDKIENFIQTKYPHIQSNFIRQYEREGTGQAILLAKEFIKPNEELLIILGDTIVDIDLNEILSQNNSVLGIKKVDDPRGFGVAEVDENLSITKVVEKPDIPKSNYALVGIYKIIESQKLFESIENIISKNIRTKEEYQLTDALMQMIDAGIKFQGYKVNNWFDCGRKEVLLETNAILLKKNDSLSAQEPLFENTIVIHPVSIAEGCKINNSIIGPNVTIGENTHINSSIIKDSIIGSFVNLNNVVLHFSLVGSDASIKGLSQSLNIGDDTEIDFS